MIYRRCREFSAGKCFRGNQCKFLHHDYLQSRDRDHPRIKLPERLRFRADDGGTLQCDNYKGSAGGPRYDISDSTVDYCEEVESRKSTSCCKDLLKGKYFRKQSCRFTHLKFAGGDGEGVNRRAVYDQSVKPLANTCDIYPCKFFPAGRCHQSDCRFFHDVSRDVTTGFLNTAKTMRCDENLRNYLNNPTWKEAAFLAYYYMDNMKVSRNYHTATDNTSHFSDSAKVTGWEEDTQKSWIAFEGLSETTKATTSCDSLPASSVKNPFSHDPQSQRWEGTFKDNIHSHVFVDVEKDGNSTHSFVQKGIENAGSGWNEYITIKDEKSFSP